MPLELGRRSVKADINVTPLVDVVLVLLIIFMAITPMLQRGEPVALPRAKAVTPLQHGGDPILLSVTGDGRLYVGERRVERRELAAALAEAIAAAPGSALVVKADRSLGYKAVRDVLAELARARVGAVSLAAAEIGPGE